LVFSIENPPDGYAWSITTAQGNVNEEKKERKPSLTGKICNFWIQMVSKIVDQRVEKGRKQGSGREK
jgi:hypothetical protein